MPEHAVERLSAALADRYRIERELGAGGMATVYLAEDLKHNRKVAIKVLKPELAAVLGAERFVQEITTTAQLQHPHILPLFDSGTADGFLFYVMPYIEGETLRDKLDRETQLGVDEAVRITREVADALDYAHRHGVIHRDIKPENILLHDGRPMVADFGIALAVSAAAGGRMTETGLSLGTPHYMSPEQATADKDITGRSDIYSLGTVLYEMLTGDPPHVGSSAQQIIMKIVTEEAAPVTKLRKSVPPNVAAALAKSLHKLPADRFATARDFAQALADPHFSAPGAVPASAPAMPSRQRQLTLGLGAITVVMTVVAAWALLRPRPEPPVIRYALALPDDQAAVPDGFVVGTSDGSRLIYEGPPAPDHPWQLWKKERDRLDAIPLSGTDGATSAAVSPDNRWLALIRGLELFKMPIAGGPTTPLARDVSNAAGTVTWLDDGTILYVKLDASRGTEAIERIDASGGAPTQVWSSDTLIATMLTALPDARGVLFQGCVAPCAEAAASLWALDLRADSAHVVQPRARVGFVVGHDLLIFVGQEQVAMAAPFDLASLRITGNPMVVTDTVSLGLGTAPYLWVAPDGGTLVMQRGTATRTTPYQFVWVDRTGRLTPVDTTERFRVTRRAADYGWSLSPDGRRVVVGVNSSSGDDIWIKSLPRGPMSKVTTSPTPDYRPHWRPDGEHITFVSDSGVFIARADGTGRDSLVWPGEFDEGVVSPDGRWVLVRRGATGPNAGGRDILGARLGIDTALTPIVATPSDEMAINLSPDGRWLAYQSDETGRLEIYVRPFPVTPAGGRIQVSARGGSGPLWSPDGRTLYYLRGDQEMMAVDWPLPADGRIEARELFHLNETLINAWLNSRYYTPWDVAADGRFLMVQAPGGAPKRGSPLIVVQNWDRELRRLMAR